MNDKIGLYAETLGAYLEGRLTKGENSLMEKVVETDSDIHEIIDEVNSTSIDWSSKIQADFPDFDRQFSLPPISESPQGGQPQVGMAGTYGSE